MDVDVTSMLKLEKLATLSQHKKWSKVWHVSWSPTGDMLATCGADKTICLWSQQDGEWRCVGILEDGHNRTIRRVEWSPNGDLLAAAAFDGTVSVWRCKEGHYVCVAQLEGHENEVKSCAFDSTGRYLATCSRDKTVWIWEIEDEDEFECISVLNGHTADVKAVIWQPNTLKLFSCGYDDDIRQWEELEDEDDWGGVCVMKGHTSTVWDISFEKDGSRFLSVSSDQSVRLWERDKTDTDKKVWSCVCTHSSDHTRPIYSVDWCRADEALPTPLFATACGDDSLRLFSVEENVSDDKLPTISLRAEMKNAHLSDINCVRFH
eukprot:CAMPEP_0201530054 /NCGR_PEP_ID=MMETSP0161_2-20130828/43580_1 /ASSEMBLY_ACC=CAM_ASM_000251 /TAXON_ID=180227 /ORGANISM="Neoparamoeba aestuarina, Strain SoJaBio B1-5/56/2" /LENGTH=319 /DNA_ID=CAMNT_0047932191 /DNA_START=18 /DNA_END=974 /DNA_ORIENTATION=+